MIGPTSEPTNEWGFKPFDIENASADMWYSDMAVFETGEGQDIMCITTDIGRITGDGQEEYENEWLPATLWVVPIRSEEMLNFIRWSTYYQDEPKVGDTVLVVTDTHDRDEELTYGPGASDFESCYLSADDVIARMNEFVTAITKLRDGVVHDLNEAVFELANEPKEDKI